MARFSGETKFFAIFAAITWLIVLVAFIAIATGSPAAINAVVGCVLPGVLATVIAVTFGREDLRRRRP